MKTKTLSMLLLLLFVFCFKPGFADTKGSGGELLFDVINSHSGKFNLTVSTTDYVWVWNKQNSTVYLLNNYSRSLSNLTAYAFDSPKDINDAPDSIVWGLMTFTIESIADVQGQGGFSFTFTLDLRDEDWNHNQTKYPGSDTHFKIDQDNGKVYYIHAGEITQTEMINNASYTIWGIWDVGNPSQSNFKVPVILSNRIEGQSFDFGNLIANNQPVNSGNPANYQFSGTKTVNVGTIDTTYLNQRNYNFIWSSNHISPTGGSNLYNSQMHFFINYSQEPKQITRNFRKVYPLTIKLNSIEGNGTIGGIGQFKDPTTTNNYENITIPSNGFVKDNAFYDLHIEVPPLTEQKYGAKAVGSISYNGRTYQYAGGDFSLTGTDFIITAPTTLVANYKGVQLSSDTSSFASNGQRKLIRTPNGYLHQVYTSLGKVWYERSTDNGVTWDIMNGGSSVSTGTAKLVSADYFNTTQGNVIAIVYQAYNSSGSNLILDLYLNGVFQQTNGLAIYSHSSGEIDNFNTNPVVAINSNGQILVSWYVDGEIAGTSYGLYYKYGYIYLAYGLYPSVSWYTSSPVIISGSGIATFNPSVSAYKSSLQPFQFVYENNNQIYFQTLTDNANHINHIEEGTVQSVSSGSGFARNNYPSVTAINGGAYAVWEGRKLMRSGTVKPSWAVAKNLITGVFSNFSNSGEIIDALAPNINIAESNFKVVLAWSENLVGYVGEPSPSTLQSLNINGKYIQLNNGGTKSQMYATTLNIGSSPFYFDLSKNIGSYLGFNKIKAGYTSVISGRKGVVYNNGAEFYFNIG